jgi:peptidoglycan/xylan/chitin deacetylase (PgdA/CDA1 family)
MRGLRFLFFVVFFLGLLIGGLTLFGPSRIVMFETLSGPEAMSEMPVRPAVQISDYSEGEASRLAVLITDEESNWLGVVHGLKTIGVPFILTEDTDRALRHEMVFVYPMISGRTVAPEDLRALAQYPQTGGTLLATNVLGGGLSGIFGFGEVRETKDHAFVDFNLETPEGRALKALGQHKIKIGSETKRASNPGSNSYLSPLQPPIAVYEDGEAAIVKRDFPGANGEGGGAAYAIGLDLGQLLLKGHNFKEDDIAFAYANQYQPTLDALLNFVANIYRDTDAGGIVLGTVPDGKTLSVMMTHDVDYKHSVANAVTYAKMEAKYGVRSTYFIQTKYIRDYNDVPFLDEEGTANLRALSKMDVEIASHSVSHSLQFHEFPIGDGAEALPDYMPYVANSDRTTKASLMGELRVSKFILENLSGREVRSFRPGYLRIPKKLPEVMDWSGYAYSSSVTANKSLTHLPFQLMESRFYETQSGIFEFPITIEDELPPRMGERLPEAIAVAERLARYGGTMVTLSHPDILGHKFEFAEGFIQAVKPYAWFGTLSEFGDWWTARDAVGVDIIGAGKTAVLQLSCPVSIKGLTVKVPENFVAGAVSGGRIEAESDAGWQVSCTAPQMTIELD